MSPVPLRLHVPLHLYVPVRPHPDDTPPLTPGASPASATAARRLTLVLAEGHAQQRTPGGEGARAAA